MVKTVGKSPCDQSSTINFKKRIASVCGRFIILDCAMQHEKICYTLLHTLRHTNTI